MDWTVRNVSRSGAAVLFLGLPALVAFVGCLTLLRAWGTDETLRFDASAALAGLWRHRVIVLLGAAVAAALAIMALVVGHSIADLPR